MIFLYQMVCLYKDPEGKYIFTATQEALRDKHTSNKEKIDLLAARVRELESNQVTNDIKAI